MNRLSITKYFALVATHAIMHEDLGGHKWSPDIRNQWSTCWYILCMPHPHPLQKRISLKHCQTWSRLRKLCKISGRSTVMVRCLLVNETMAEEERIISNFLHLLCDGWIESSLLVNKVCCVILGVGRVWETFDLNQLKSAPSQLLTVFSGFDQLQTCCHWFGPANIRCFFSSAD